MYNYAYGIIVIFTRSTIKRASTRKKLCVKNRIEFTFVTGFERNAPEAGAINLAIPPARPGRKKYKYF